MLLPPLPPLASSSSSSSSPSSPFSYSLSRLVVILSSVLSFPVSHCSACFLPNSAGPPILWLHRSAFPDPRLFASTLSTPSTSLCHYLACSGIISQSCMPVTRASCRLHPSRPLLLPSYFCCPHPAVTCKSRPRHYTQPLPRQPQRAC